LILKIRNILIPFRVSFSHLYSIPGGNNMVNKYDRVSLFYGTTLQSGTLVVWNPIKYTTQHWDGA